MIHLMRAVPNSCIDFFMEAGLENRAYAFCLVNLEKITKSSDIQFNRQNKEKVTVDSKCHLTHWLLSIL